MSFAASIETHSNHHKFIINLRAQADSIAPSELRRAVCTLEKLDLFGEAQPKMWVRIVGREAA